MSRKGKVSSKVLAALAKGRKKLASLRRKKSPGRRKKAVRRIPEKLEPIVIKGAYPMAKRKKRRKARRSMGGEFLGTRKRRRSRARYHGGEFFGGKRKRRRSVRRYHGDATKGIAGSLMNAGMIAAGGIAGAFAAKFAPLPSPKMKAMIPLALGIGLSMTKFGKKGMMQKMTTGMAVVGVLSLVRAFMPSIPTLAGDDDMMGLGYVPTPEEAAILGLEDYSGEGDYYGASEDFGNDFDGEGDIEALQAENIMSPADIS